MPGSIYFTELTDLELITQLKDLQQQYAAASRNISVGSGDVTASRQLADINARIREIYGELNVRIPSQYPLTDSQPTTRVRVSFSPYLYWRHG